MVLYRITPQSGIDHDLVSVVKILLKAFFLVKYQILAILCDKTLLSVNCCVHSSSYVSKPRWAGHVPHKGGEDNCTQGFGSKTSRIEMNLKA
jgi:hypothetical protein